MSAGADPAPPNGAAVVLVSGGLDSAVTLAMARAAGHACYALSFDYGQRHRVELERAAQVAASLGAERHRVLRLPLSELGGSALTDTAIDLPQQPQAGIPVTYVPARNTVFLALALAWAEVIPARHLYIGANAVDYSGYPDCRPEFIQAFERLSNVATRAGVEGAPFRVHAPLIALSKAEIIRAGDRLGVDFALTSSCYGPDESGRACGRCDSCRIRAEGFRQAGIDDPTPYVR